MTSDPAIAVLCGGVGAARMLAGLVQVADPATITAVVNTGDDCEMHGLAICPDIDTIVYTLSGAVNTETGWGLSGESWQAMEALEQLGGPERTWFRLGDRDLGTHLYRTGRLREGASLTEVTAELAKAHGLELRLLPMSDEPVRTVITLAGGDEVAFQEYFVKLRHEVTVRDVRFDAVGEAVPGPQVLAGLRNAGQVVIAPSNPVVSVGPILALAGVTEVLTERRETVVAVSPIVGGRALKGPADRLLVELGGEASVVGVARLLYAVAGTLVIDEVDAPLAARVEAVGMRAVIAPSVMSDLAASARLAEAVIAASA